MSGTARPPSSRLSAWRLVPCLVVSALLMSCDGAGSSDTPGATPPDPAAVDANSPPADASGQVSDGDCPFAPLAEVSRITGEESLEHAGRVQVTPNTASCTFLPGNDYFYLIEAHRGVDPQQAMSQLREQYRIGRDSTMSEVLVDIGRGTAYFFESRTHGLVQAAAVDGDRLVLVMAPFLDLSPEGHAELLELALDRLADGHGP